MSPTPPLRIVKDAATPISISRPCAIDDETAIKVVDDEVAVVSEDQWKLFDVERDPIAKAHT